MLSTDWNGPITGNPSRGDLDEVNPTHWGDVFPADARNLSFQLAYAPEPDTFDLILVGAAGVLFTRRRRPARKSRRKPAGGRAKRTA
jgi:hypothetical protein